MMIVVGIFFGSMHCKQEPLDKWLWPSPQFGMSLPTPFLIFGLTSFSTTKMISRWGKFGGGPEPLVEWFLFTMHAVKKYACGAH